MILSVEASPNGRTVWGIYCLWLLKHWNRVFESHSRHRYVSVLFCVCVVLCR